MLNAFESGRLDEAQARAALAEVFALRAEVARLNAGSPDERQALQEAREKLALAEHPELRDAVSRLTRAALVLQLPAALFSKE